jgi:HlyD family secretion protein
LRWAGSGFRLRRTKPDTLYIAAPALRGPLTVAVTATGTVEPTNLVEILSALSGTLRTVNVDHNDPVTVGEGRAPLDAKMLEAALAHSRAALEACPPRPHQRGSPEI